LIKEGKFSYSDLSQMDYDELLFWLKALSNHFETIKANLDE